MTTSHSEFLHGISDELPILLLGVLLFGMIYGVSALSAGIPASNAQAMSCIVFAGSAQGVLAQLIAASTPSLVVILTAFIVNIRHMLYSASVSAYTCKLHPLWKWLLAYLLTDEAYAVIILHYQKPGDTKQKHWYFLGAGLALWTTWQLSTAVGMFLVTNGIIGRQKNINWPIACTIFPPCCSAYVGGSLEIRLIQLPISFTTTSAT